MKKNKNQILRFFFGLALGLTCAALVFFSFTTTVFAQDNVQSGDVVGTAEIDQNVALGNESLTKTAVRIINVGLSLLGIVALGIVLYGGFVYMTSGGSEEKVATAKKILVNGTIGLVIILSAWAITSFVLRNLGDATGVKGMGDGVPSACRDPEFANNNIDICFPGNGGNIPGGENQDCAVRNKKVLLVRGITPSTPTNDAGTGMNNAKVRVLFNNAIAQNDAAQVYQVVRIENSQEVDVTNSFQFHFVSTDPTLVEAVFQGQNGLDQLPQGEYRVRVKKDLKGRENQNLVEKVACGDYPSETMFRVNTNGVIDNQAPALGALLLNGKAADPQAEQLPRGKVHTYTFAATDNSGIGYVQFHIAVMKNGQQISVSDYYDIPKVSAGSKATLEKPFNAKLPLAIPVNTELFNEYVITASVFDIDGNSTQTQFKAIVVGASCAPGKQGAECLDDDRSCNNDLQCASKKCVNNQCVAWPVITNLRPSWDGAAGNYVTIQGNYFGENSGKVEFGFEQDGNIRWVLASQPACDGRDLWHNEQIIVSVPGDELPVGARAVIRVTKPAEQGQAEGFADTTIDNHGPVPGPNTGRFIKNSVKRPGICSVGVAPGNPNLPAGATSGPVNTELEIVGTAFGAREQGQVRLNSIQGEIAGWSDDRVRTRIPRNMNPGRVDVSILQGEIASNDLPFFVSNTVQLKRPTITSIDPINTTAQSYITIVGKNFGDESGEVFLAPDANTNCRPEGRLNEACKIMSTETCGKSWSDTQIIAQIPANAQVKGYVVVVERREDLLPSQGDNKVNVVEGNPRPSICFFNPKAGPAPLATGSAGLKFKGVNFSNNPSIYFWPGGAAKQDDIETWMVQRANNIHKVQSESNTIFTSVTTSIPLVNGISLAKGPAPIKLKNAEGGVSNQVVYTVADCRDNSPLEGYHCCADGADAGFFKPNGQVCKGETRDAGYAWRFTTGRIPEIPQVIENCVTSTPAGMPPVFPSPAPWEGWLGPEAACLNQSIAIRFQLPAEATLENINQNTVKVFRCAEKDNNADCSGDKKAQVAFQAGDLDLAGGSYLTILKNTINGPSRFLPNTWYQVELSKQIGTFRNVTIGGIETVERQTLLVKRSCSNDTAYCFQFKTGAENNRCDLDRVGVAPNPFTVRYLGVLQYPALFDATRPFNPPVSSTLAYKVWGSGTQNCSVLDVEGFGWQWRTNDAQKASVERFNINIDSKAKVTARANTVPGTVGIEATSSTARGEKTGHADLTIDLGEPKVIDYWPNCTESCVNAGLGVKFDRQMFQESLNINNIKLYKCLDELCNNPQDAEMDIHESDKDYYTFRFDPVQPLEKATWYKIELSSDIRGVGSLGEDDSPDDDEPGKNIDLNVFHGWRFRTTLNADSTCLIDKVEIQPKNFIARQIGERTKYNSFPRTAPNSCSKLGQNLNPWMYGWEWNATPAAVASVSHFEYQGSTKSFCGINCLPVGSDVASGFNGTYPVCGNNHVDPGEDCDIGDTANEVPGVTCTLNCLRPGNKNANNQLCGNGAVDVAQGEECDPRNADHGAFCTNTCNWEGSGTRLENATSTAWCGSATKSFGEDCDIAITSTTTPDGFIGCSNQCLHRGTPTSQEWCTKHAGDNYASGKIRDTVECGARAVSICGNHTLEVGEECEYLADGTGIQVAIDLETNPGNPNVVFAATSSLKVCTNRCLLGNICTLGSIPNTANNGPRCEKGTQGCTDGCHVAGSSVTYDEPSFCGDGNIRGLGKYAMCEVSNQAPAANRLGQNPVQMVTAVGRGDVVNGQTPLQRANITAKAVNIKDGNGNPRVSQNQPVGVGSYALQCGYTEKLPSTNGNVNLLQDHDGDMEQADLNAWINGRHANAENFRFEKNQEQKFEGARSMHLTGRGTISLSRLAVKPGAQYMLRLRYKLVAGEFVAYRPGEIGEMARYTVTSTAPDAWLVYQRQFTIPQNIGGGSDGYSLNFYAPKNETNLYIDNATFEEVIPTFEDTTNDCPGAVNGNNTNNLYGVGKNSCCLVRPTRVDSYPQNGSENVCRNTFISLTFDSHIDESSIDKNILLVSGHGPNFRCAADEVEVTDQVKSLISLNVNPIEKPGILKKMWGNVKQFFATVFGVQKAEAFGDGLSIWCNNPSALKHKVVYESSDDLRDTTTTVSLYLSSALLPNTEYGLVLRGGNTGIKDVSGVGVRNPILTSNKYHQTDLIQFKTGSDICRITSVAVQPESKIFTRPNSTSTFQALVRTANNTQQIQPLEGIYAWGWSWLPHNNDIFAIPAAGSPADEDSVVVASKSVEGSITGVALANVTVDVSAQNNQLGRVFSAPFQLQASFCENPWPPSPYFPYEEGISFGKQTNNNGVTSEGRFSGSELLAVNLGSPAAANPAYFNVSFSYCADANQSATTTDDLPYLRPIVFGNIFKGVCQYPEGISLNEFCSFDSQCNSNHRNGFCANERTTVDATVAEGILKKFLFVNDKNDDAIGLQIAQNTDRLSARQWYTKQFPGANMSELKDITVAGYTGVSDGKSYYINALNQAGNPSSAVYNNIYIFSINGNAQADTRKVFEKILSSLKFNINISDVGYCLASENSNPPLHQTLSDNFNRVTEITDIACQTDFDCRDKNGIPLSDSNGVCSNAKTKLLRDWDRLSDIRSLQQKLQSYKNGAGAGKYPLVDAGSFVPGYTNSRWNVSWGNLGRLVGGVPQDRINNWTSCGNLDPQTCWNAASSTVQCPAFSSILEYEVSPEGDYTLHSPLEYFNLNEPLNPVIADFIPDVNKFTTEPWCRSDEVIAATAGQCGNGVVNLSSGEECDPPGTLGVSNRGLVDGRPGACEISKNVCQRSVEDCGYIVNIPAPPASNAQIRGMAKTQSFCSGSGSAADAILSASGVIARNGVNYYKTVPCTTDISCQNIKTYAKGNQSVVSNNVRSSMTYVNFSAFLTANKNRFRCLTFQGQGGADRQLGDVAVQATPQQCLGAVAAVNGVGQCPNSETASRLCTSECKYSYGMCQSSNECGNGIIEGREVCDSGALKGQYGQCNANCTGVDNFCGDGVKNGDNEACEVVSEVQRSLPFPNEQTKIRTIYGSNFDIPGYCHRTAGGAEFEPACVTIMALTLGSTLELNSDPKVLNSRCQNDTKLLCDPNRKEAGTNRHLDCLAPTNPTGFDFERYNRESPTISDYSSQDLTYYGPCIAKNNVIYGSEYNLNKNLSCNASCTQVGEYCGDGIIHAPQESCDDKNNVSGDGCSATCKVETAAVANNNVPVAPQCGNGTVDQTEACDLKDQNGKACIPQYGRSCTYCAADCRSVLTVDPTAYCGDNVFQSGSETCEVVNNVITAATSTPNGQLVCPTNYKGQYSCTNQCSKIGTSCVLCQKLAINQGAVTPRLKVLNPMSNFNAQLNIWKAKNKVGFYVKRDALNNTVVSYPVADIGKQFHLEGIYYRDIDPGNDFQSLTENGEGIQANQLCSNEYALVFNRQELVAKGENCPNNVCPANAQPDAGSYLMTGKESLFPYPVTTEGNGINNEIIASPAVPPNFIRVVVKWTQAENQDGISFQGILQNNGFVGRNKIIRPSDFANKICNRIRLNDNNPFKDYWMPDCDNNFIEGSVYIHPQINGTKTFIQSMTIRLNGGEQIAADLKRDYAFYVQAFDANGVVPIGNMKARDISVEVYNAINVDQNPTYSVYKPFATYHLNAASGENSLAQYWHVFNIVRPYGDIAVYQIQGPRTTRFNAQTNQNELITFPEFGGKLADSTNDILCYVPTEECRPE